MASSNKTNGGLKDRVALITGGSRGIGRAVATALAERGTHLALIGRDGDGLRETAREAQSHGVQAVPFTCDVRDTHQIMEVVAAVHRRFKRLDILINNAGIFSQTKADAEDLELFDAMLDVNLRASVHFTRHTLDHIKESDAGAIINIASIAGKASFGKTSGYCATKWGVVGYSGAIFEDVRALGIKVSAICPGFVNTAMADGRGMDGSLMIQAEDIARTVLFVLDFPKTGCPTEIVIRPQHPL